MLETAPRRNWRTPSEHRVAWLILVIALGIGAVPRVWLALNDAGMFWGDEIYQSIEPAHRLVFGYGLLPWEYVIGARSWAWPGLIAGILKVTAIVGLDRPDAYLPILRCILAGVSLATVLGIYRLSRAFGAGQAAAAVGSAAWCLMAPAIYFAPRALGDSVSTLPVVVGVAFTLAPGMSRRMRVVGASLLGAAVLIHYANALMCIGVMVALLVQRRWRPFIESGFVLLAWAVLLGLSDLVTWGSWFHSIQPWIHKPLLAVPHVLGPRDGGLFYYGRIFLVSSFPAGFMVLALAAIGAVRAWPVALAGLIFILLLPGDRSSEFRYLLPAIPLMCALGAVGLDSLGRAAPGASKVVAVAVLAAALVSTAGYHRLTLKDLGRRDGPFFERISAYDWGGPMNRLIRTAGTQSDICGLFIAEYRAGYLLVWTGGYTYFHRDVPLFDRSLPAGPRRYNYSIYGRQRAHFIPGTVVAVDHDLALIRAPDGDCIERSPVATGDGTPFLTLSRTEK